MRVLVTGAAGFIGYHTAKYLLSRGDSVSGVDSINDYYDPKLKEDRIKNLSETNKSGRGEWIFHHGDLSDEGFTEHLFSDQKFDRVIHLAAQAGVRHSLSHPHDYVNSNIVAFTNVLENCRHRAVAHLTYASTSSVYGGNTKLPYSPIQTVDHPLQFYAATKRANELMAHSYSHLFELPTTGLRFFTAYGPWGRPDMALFIFTRNILNGVPIQLFNNGDHGRDFTYIDDIVQGVILASDNIATKSNEWDSDNPTPHESSAPFRILNIGRGGFTLLHDYVAAIERRLGKKAIIEYKPMQAGDIAYNQADISLTRRLLGYEPSTTVEVGVNKFIDWYLGYYSER